MIDFYVSGDVFDHAIDHINQMTVKQLCNLREGEKCKVEFIDDNDTFFKTGDYIHVKKHEGKHVVYGVSFHTSSGHFWTISDRNEV